MFFLVCWRKTGKKKKKEESTRLITVPKLDFIVLDCQLDCQLDFL